MSQDKKFSFKPFYESEDDFLKYKENSLSLFALSLYLRIEDIDEFASDSITAGSDDKKLYICHIDVDDNRAILVQSYISKTWGKAAAPANKASDLNTAVAWLLSSNINKIPKHLKEQAVELRSAVRSEEIKRIEIFYIHNCSESQNVEYELKTVADATRDIVKSINNNTEIVVSHKELGIESIEELFTARDKEILIDETLELPTNSYLLEKNDNWQAVLTSIPGEWINKLYNQHGDRLFSANYRDYLGAIRRTGNINYEISQTAESEPGNFWVYNNGITALTHKIEFEKDKIIIRGLSIINGAQTSGALGSISIPADSSLKVLVRFVECKKNLIHKIIQFNNTQNDIKPFDRRSNDPLQRRLANDFDKFSISYIHRRTSLRIPKNSLTAASLATALCAFHGDPQIAYRQAKEIINNDDIYQRVFPNNISVEHIFLVRALSVSMTKVKVDLKNKITDETATQIDEKEYEILKYSAAKHFLFYIVGSLAEEIMRSRVSDLFNWRCKKEVISSDNVSLSKAWVKVIYTLLPQIVNTVSKHGKDAAYEVPRSMNLTRQVKETLKANIASLSDTLDSQFQDIRKRTVI